MTEKNVSIARADIPALISPGTVTLITGSSGSGKSSLLPRIVESYVKPTSLAYPSADRSKPLIDAWPSSARSNIGRLTAVGLGDPITWARTYAELSVGQQARLHIADLLASPGGLIVIDEWLNGLDDLTARAVAWATGKALRRAGRSAILVTSQRRLIYDLNPHFWIDVQLMQDAICTWPDSDCPESTISREITYDKGTSADWLYLKPFHYAAGSPATVHSYHVLRHPGLPGPAAVALLSWPDLHSSARNLALCDHFRNVNDRAVAQDLNRSLLRLSRIVVTPELRQIGLARCLIAEIANRVDVPYLECSTAMARYTPFLEKAGFLETPNALNPHEAAWMDFAARHAVPYVAALSPQTLRDTCKGLSVRNARQAHRLVWTLYHHLVLHRRTRSPKPARVPNLTDPRWTAAFDLAARRLNDRPAYWLLKLNGRTSIQEAPPCPKSQSENESPDPPNAAS